MRAQPSSSTPLIIRRPSAGVLPQPLRCPISTPSVRQCTCSTPSSTSASLRWRCHAQESEQGSTIMDNERVIASLTSVGISGTAAVVGASLVNINLWREFQWSVSDFRLAFTIGAALLVYEFVLLGLPWYTQLLQQQAARQAQVTELDTTTTTTTTTTNDALVSPSSDASTPSPSSASSASSADDDDGNASLPRPQPFNLVLDDELVLSDGQVGFTPAALKATLGLQLACFAAIATAKQGELPVPLDASLIVLRESAKELLQRGLIVTLVGGWLADRSFEAGADEMVMLGSMQMYTTDACRWAAAGLATLAFLPPVLADAQALSLSVATNWALLLTSAHDDKELSKDLRDYRFLEALQQTADAPVPTQLTQALHTIRGMLRFASLHIVFVLTQNLSASLLLSVTSNLLLLVYNRRTREELVRQKVMRP